jgi:heterodisulfide reductase subunit A
MSDEPRVGVLLCSCTPEMSEKLDFEALSSFSEGRESVVHVEKHPVWCLAPGISRLKQLLDEKEIDRIVVAGCSYRTHRHIFEAALEDAGRNPYLLEIVNVKDHCVAVHPEDTTECTIDQVGMGIARSATLLPLEEITVPAEQRALVVGGGISGLVAARTLAAAGCEVVLVEQDEELGGYLCRMEGGKAPDNGGITVSGIRADVESNSSIEKLVSSSLVGVDGEPGGLDVTLKTPDGEKCARVGAIILATGSSAAPANGAYGHDGETVKTQEEFAEILYREEPVARPLSIVMIQCVGSRNEERPFCSRVCCHRAVKNATAARQEWPDTEVAILFRDLEMGCLTERDVKRAREAGVALHRFDQSAPPVVEGGKVSVRDTMTGQEISILHDLIVLSVGEIPRQTTKEVADLLNIKTDVFGFIPEPAVRLRPMDSAGRGIFVTGSAHWPVTTEESMYQAFEMASRAAMDLKQGRFRTRPIVASVDESRCIGCHLCESMCAWGAIEVAESAAGNKARVQEILCKGCGTCVASCPVFAIRAAHYSDEQIKPSITAAVTS